MDIFQFSYHSIGYLSGTIFSAFLIVCLLALRKKTDQSWILVLYLFFTLFLNFGFLARTSLFSPLASKPASFLIALYTSFSNLVLLSFIYSFARHHRKKEPWIVLTIVFLAGAFGFSYYVLKNIDSPVFYNFNIQMFEFQKPESTAPMGALHFLTFLWILVVIARKISDEKKKHSATNAFSAPSFFLEANKNLRMWRSFAWAVGAHASFSLTYVLYGLGYISFSNFQFILTSATSLQLFLYLVIYLNYFPQPSSFMVKIVGLSLATVLILLGIVARITFLVTETFYDTAREMEIENIRENLKYKGSYSLPENIVYLASHPLDENRYGSELLVHRNVDPRILSNLLEKNDIDDIKKSFRSLNESSSKFGFSYPQSPFRIAEYGIQVSSTKNFRPRRMYRVLSFPGNVPAYIIRYVFTSEDRIYEIGYPYESYARLVHSIVSTMGLILLFTVILLLILLPYLFREGLVRPLQLLLNGVKQVNAGNYDNLVPVQSDDEIGFLSRSFNRMVISIRGVRKELKDYTETLEDMLILKTKELTENSKRIESKNRNIIESLEYSSLARKALLPSTDSVRKALGETFILDEPGETQSGNFHWFLDREEDAYFAVGDCIKHGIPGVFLSTIVHTLLNRILTEEKIAEPGAILDRLHQLIGLNYLHSLESIHNEKGIRICLIRISKSISYFAGANSPLWLAKDSEVYRIEGDPYSIGIDPKEGSHKYKTHSLPISPGIRTVVYLSSNGYEDNTEELFSKLKEIQNSTFLEQEEELRKFSNFRRKQEMKKYDTTLVGIVLEN